MLKLLLEQSFYDNVDPVRKQERVDARRISEDHSKMANLPQEGFQKQFNAWKYVEHINMFDQSDYK